MTSTFRPQANLMDAELALAGQRDLKQEKRQSMR